METAIPIRHYACRLTVSATPKEIYDALTNRIKVWWTITADGEAKKIGDIFTARFGSTCKTFRVNDLVTNDTVVWQCTGSYINVPAFQHQDEWTGTKIVWEISTGRHGTGLIMTHIRLIPGMECYEIGEKGWEYYLNESLDKFLNTGKGLPFAGEMGQISSREGKISF